MSLSQVIMIILTIALIYFAYDWLFGKHALTGISDAKVAQNIASTAIDSTSSSYTYSIFCYCDSFDYKYSEPKEILTRLGVGSLAPCPALTFGATQNNLLVSIACYPENGSTDSANNSVTHTCNVANFPLQKWTQICVSINGRICDVYIDGKLVKTCPLPGVSKVDSAAPLVITGNGGFSGWTANLQYWNKPLSPDEVWTVYKKGYGGSWFSQLFGQYSVKVSLMQGNAEAGSVSV